MKLTVTCLSDHPTVAFAAGELSGYLRRMLPGEGDLALRLAVTPEPGPDAPERFSVRVTRTEGSITANCPRGVLLAVYDYLRHLGCRFLLPGRAGEVIPVIGPERLPADYEKRASFRHRGVCIEGAVSRENVLDLIDWLPKLGYNSFFLQFKTPYVFLARWYYHEGNPLRAPEDYTEADAEADARLFEAEMARRGLLLHKVGHGWTGEVLGFRSVSWDPDGGKLSPALRHRAAELNGRRDLFHQIPTDTNLCYSDPDARDAFATLVVEYARDHPGVDYLHIWLADEYNNVCECPRCRETTLSDQYVSLLNEIDSRLTAEGLDTRLVFLLYQELLWPPRRERLKDPDRFVLMFAPISRTFEHSYQLEGELPDLPEYCRNKITLPTDLRENLAFLRGWQRQFSGDSFIYDYPMGRAFYGDFGYVKLAEVISGDIKQLHRMGLGGYISCQELRIALPNAITSYVMGYTLLDEKADVAELEEEYFSAAYGRDWAAVRDYLTRLSELSSTDYVNGKGPRKNLAFAADMEAARALCRDFWPVIGSHRRDGQWENCFWAALDFHSAYISRLSRALACLARGEMAEADARWREFRDFICESEPQFQPLLDVYRVLEVTAKYTGFSAGDGRGT